jgi:hypothetical protein
MLDNLLYNNVFNIMIGEKILLGPLLSGRHRCSFSTIIGDDTFNIQGSQYETDGCYETENYICIVEAKSSNYKDFNIRQLYYPYRAVYDACKIAGNKKTIIALFIYKDRAHIIHVHKFTWKHPLQMLSITQLDYYEYY